MTAKSDSGPNKKRRLFYGWYMIPVAVMARLCTGPGQSYGMTNFYSSFIESLHVTNTELTAAYMGGTLIGCLPMSYVGRLLDTRGIRWTMTYVVLFLGLACFFTSQIGGLFSLFLAFMFLRMLGQASLSLCAGNILAMWFHRKLGLVTGVLNQSFPVALLVVPQFIRYLISSLGWRMAYVVLGVLVWVIMFPILALVFKNRPEEIGEQQDGAPHSDEAGDSPDLKCLTLEEAKRERSYRILLPLNFIWGMIATAIIFCAVPLFESHGFGPESVSTMFTVFAFSSAVTLFLGGLLVNRIPLNVLMCIGISGMAVGIAFLVAAKTSAHIVGYAICFGGGQGLLSILEGVIWVRYFGRDHLGSIRGRSWRAAVAGSSVGPFVMGVTRDLLGSYQVPLTVFGILLGLLSLLALFATEPVKEATGQNSGDEPPD